MAAVVWVLVLGAGAARADELRIDKGADAVTVATGRYQWQLSTKTFDVVHAASVGGKARLGPGRATVEALGGHVVFGAPTEVKTGGDWVELRGWADRDKHLWYVARYQFWAGQPDARLVLTLTDRHDQSPGEQSDKYWQHRTLARWRLEVGAPGGHPSQVTQHSSYSFSSPGGPWLEVISKSGAPYQWALDEMDTSRGFFQLVHAAGDPANQIVWHPGVTGPVELTAVVKPYQSGAAYLAARGASYEIVDAAGKVHAVAGDQAKETIPLGRFTLGRDSVVRLKAVSANPSCNILAGPLRVAPQAGKPFEITPGSRYAGVLADGPVTIALKDFWEHHPVTLFRTDATIGWQAIESPEEYTGGMGLTLETMLAIDGPSAAATTALYAPPARTLPPNWAAVDGSLNANPKYDALIKSFSEHLGPALELMDNFGWRNWGDYQIGNSYTDRTSGENIEEWGNLQYDLPHGALLAWLRTGDPALWDFAQASVRHLMDLDLVKFYPFEEKINGLVYRKGEMSRRRSHIDAEPITAEGFAYRSLLLYYHLTGEEWARDLAKQLIDRLAYYATTRPKFVVGNGSGRDQAWMLRGPLAGAVEFGKEPYQAVADQVVNAFVDFYKANRPPARQTAGLAGPDPRGARDLLPTQPTSRGREDHRRQRTQAAHGLVAPRAGRPVRVHVLPPQREGLRRHLVEGRELSLHVALRHLGRGPDLARSVLLEVGRHALRLRRDEDARPPRHPRVDGRARVPVPLPRAALTLAGGAELPKPRFGGAKSRAAVRGLALAIRSRSR